MHIRLRDSVSGELVNCSFAKTLYPKSSRPLEVDDSIIYVRGENCCQARRSAHSINDCVDILLLRLSATSNIESFSAVLLAMAATRQPKS